MAQRGRRTSGAGGAGRSDVRGERPVPSVLRVKTAWAVALSLQKMSFFPKVGQNLGTLVLFWLTPKEAAGVLFGVIQQEK